MPCQINERSEETTLYFGRNRPSFDYVSHIAFDYVGLGLIMLGKGLFGLGWIWLDLVGFVWVWLGLVGFGWVCILVLATDCEYNIIMN